MDNHAHQASFAKSLFLILLMVGIVFFKGWFAYTVIGDLGQPDWDYRPIADVYGESAYAYNNPYHPLPYPQHVRAPQGQEEYPLQILNLHEEYRLQGDQ